MLLAVDPGLSTGWALFELDRLHSCDGGDPPFQLATKFIVEKPQVYPGTPASKANNLVTLAFQAGGYWARAGQFATERVQVLPHAWKGDTPKPIHHQRVWRTLLIPEQVTAEATCPGLGTYLEKCRHSVTLRKPAPGGKHADVMDAIGLGLFALNRLRP